MLIGSMAHAVHRPNLACVNQMDPMIDSTPENARNVLTALQAARDARNSEKLAITIQQLTNEGVPLPVLAGLS